MPNSRCEPTTGGCVCNPGYSAVGGECVALPPGDPAGRTQAEVCSQWAMGHVEKSSMAWTGGPTTCDPGTMDPVAIDDTLRRLAMFRWLAGLGPVDHDASRHSELMECANMMNVNNALSHSPPTDWDCYTSGGASAAGRSNIALGSRTPGSAIDGYMSDRNTPSLGHRRWILGERLASVEIGFAGRGQCLGVFGGGGSSDRDWTAYPNQGFAPIETAQNTWSFHSNGPNDWYVADSVTSSTVSGGFDPATHGVEGVVMNTMNSIAACALCTRAGGRFVMKNQAGAAGRP